MIFEKRVTQLDECTESIEIGGMPLPEGLTIEERFLLYQLAEELKTNKLSIIEFKTLAAFVRQIKEARTKPNAAPSS